jgi:hypothetical protein
LGPKGVSPKLLKGFSHLSVGRHGKVPPNIILRNEYRKLVIELKSLRNEFPKMPLPIGTVRSKAIFEFARKTSARWLSQVEAGQIGLDQIFAESPEAAAKLSLAATYGCSEEAVHSRLFHNSR